MSFTRKILVTESSMRLMRMCLFFTKKRGSYLETEFLFEEGRNEVAVGVHLNTIPAGVGSHNGGNSFGQGSVVSGHVDVEQTLLVYDRVVLVDASHRSSVSHIVLCTSQHLCPAPKTTPSEEGSSRRKVGRKISL